MIIIIICSITFSLYATNLDELQEQKNNIQNQVNESSSELENINNELTENLEKIQKIDDNIMETETAILELTTKISNYEQEIIQIQKQLDSATQKYEEQKNMLNNRLVAIYEMGEINYLNLILNSNSITDFVANYHLISTITSYDIEFLKIVMDRKEQIENKKIDLENTKVSLEQSKRTVQKTQITLSNTKLLRENLIIKLSDEEKKIQSKIDEYNKQINEIEQEIKGLATIQTFGEEYKGGPMMWPIYGHYTVTSNYGMRVHPITGVYKLHTGVDIGATMGTNFTAIANGIIVKAEYNAAYGNMVIIDHGGGVQTLYAHGSEIVAVLGQEVKAGDIVLKVGSTGYSTGPHAHFEVRINGTTVNPLEYVKIPEG